MDWSYFLRFGQLLHRHQPMVQPVHLDLYTHIYATYMY